MMPVAVTAITPVLKKYGFQESQMGMMQLALAGSPYKEDAEIAVLSKAMREKMVPAEMLPVINAMMGVQLPNIQMPQMPPMQMPFGLPVCTRRLARAGRACCCTRLTRRAVRAGHSHAGLPGAAAAAGRTCCAAAAAVVVSRVRSLR